MTILKYSVYYLNSSSLCPWIVLTHQGKDFPVSEFGCRVARAVGWDLYYLGFPWQILQIAYSIQMPHENFGLFVMLSPVSAF